MSDRHPSAIDLSRSFVKTGDVAHLGGISSYEWQNVLMDYAEANRREGEPVGKTLVRLAKCDATAQALAHAANAAEAIEARLPIEGRLALLKRSMAPEPVTPAQKVEHGSAAHIEKVLDDLVKALKRPDETFAQCYARLMTEDEAFRGAYAAFLEKRRI